MDCTTYRYLMGEINKSCNVPHHLYPGHNVVEADIMQLISKNLNDSDDIDILDILKGKTEFLSKIPCFDSFMYKIHTCHPIKCGSNLSDIYATILRNKLMWEQKLKTLRTFNVDTALKTIKRLREKKTRHVPKSVRKYLNYFRNDPEPNFNGSYNWMYTGGNLFATQANDQIILLCEDSLQSSSSSSSISVLQCGLDLNKPSFITNHVLKKKQPVLQILGQQFNNDGLLLAVRQKNYMNILVMNDTDEPYIIDQMWRKKVKDSKLLNCLAFSEDCQCVISSDTKGDVNVFDVETKKKTFGYGKRMLNKDSWNQVLADEGKFYFVDRTFLNVLDPRYGCMNPVFVFMPSVVINICEDISSMALSKLDPNYLYLSTTHKLTQVDKRMGKEVQQWTHQMAKPPQFMSVIKKDNKDFLILQSCDSEETIGIINGYANNEEEHVHLHSTCLPCSLKGIKHCFRHARMKGLCLNPHIAKRFYFSITGIQCLKGKDDELDLLTINSGGDIFLSRIWRKEGEDDDAFGVDKEFSENMKKYESETAEMWMRKPSKTYTQLKNLSKIREDLKTAKVGYHERKRKMYWKYDEMYSDKSLIHYKDVLASKILKVWGINSEEFDLFCQISPETKVEEWMNTL